MLSPEVISQMSRDANKTAGYPARVFLNKIEFSYQDAETKKRSVHSIDGKIYSKFYSLISGDKSITDIPINLASSFNEMPASSLVITIQDMNKNNPNKVDLFQEVQFLYKGDYYRVELRESSGANWIYFYHPQIYDKVLHLFTSEQS